MTDDGRPLSGVAGDRDLTPWICIDHSDTLTDAAHPKDIDVEVNLPAEARGSFWAAVFIDSWSEVSNGQGGKSVRVGLRIAVPIVVTAAESADGAFEFANLSATVDGGEHVLVTARVRNIGDTAALAPVVFALERYDAPDAPIEISSADSESVLILPGRSRTITARLTGAPVNPAHHSVSAFFRFGAQRNEVARATTAVVLPVD